MTDVIVLLVGIVIGFVGGWFACSRWGGKVKAVEEAVKKP